MNREMFEKTNHLEIVTIHVIIITSLLFLSYAVQVSHAQNRESPVDLLKQQEKLHSNTSGEMHLGIVMTVFYPAYEIVADEHYYAALAEVVNALKTPKRIKYRFVLKGFTDTSGRSWDNFHISLKRAEALRDLLVQHPQMSLDGSRIQVEGFGETNPVATNETPEGRAQNRRVEIHVYGEVAN